MSETSSASTEADSPINLDGFNVKKLKIWNPALDDGRQMGDGDQMSPKLDDHRVPEQSKVDENPSVVKNFHNQHFLQQAAALNKNIKEQMALTAAYLSHLQQHQQLQNQNTKGKINHGDQNFLPPPIQLMLQQMRFQSASIGGPIGLPGCFPPGIPMPLLPLNGFPSISVPRLPMPMNIPNPHLHSPQISTVPTPSSMNPITQAVLEGKPFPETDFNVCGYCEARFKLVGDLTQHLRDNHRNSRKRKHDDVKVKNLPESSHMAQNLCTRSKF